MFEAGKLQALVGAEYALADFVDALNCLSQRRAVGKIVVTI
jgi:NADPH:quinone reductase-like Zn-dependent oxidoreductase